MAPHLRPDGPARRLHELASKVLERGFGRPPFRSAGGRAEHGSLDREHPWAYETCSENSLRVPKVDVAAATS